jgi:hypothetical protein
MQQHDKELAEHDVLLSVHIESEGCEGCVTPEKSKHTLTLFLLFYSKYAC